jgi:sterol desaturase/sphingolipid hydroxylase (fatty acid hydroxylase superfamily)
MSFAIAFAAGLVLWTVLEYVLHRWVFHGRVLGKRLAREHLLHHAKVDWFAPWSMKLALAVPILSVLGVLGVLAAGAPGAGLASGTFCGWVIYEWIHRQIHVAAPRNAYARWARANHLSHHFGKVHANHGVTSPIWDHVFGSVEPPGVIAVPRVYAQKFPWLIEDREGKPAVRAAYASGYRVT